jgi:DMSO/TMAO reductase YedYZ molybdopterin-dependent catalytic subunit
MAITSKTSGDRMGFWELNGCHNDADPWLEQRHWF